MPHTKASHWVCAVRSEEGGINLNNKVLLLENIHDGGKEKYLTILLQQKILHPRRNNCNNKSKEIPHSGVVPPREGSPVPFLLEHMLGYWFSPGQRCMWGGREGKGQGAANGYFSLSSIFLSLSFFLTSPLSKNK